MTDKQPRNDDNEYPSGEHRGDVRAAGPDLKSLRLPSNYGATLGVEKLLTNVTICRPKKTQFFRTHISDEMTYPVMLLENKEAHEYYVVELELPARVDRKVGAELVTRYFFPVSHRSIEAWPLAWRHVNGKALAETAELFAFAQSKLDAASPIRGGRRHPRQNATSSTNRATENRVAGAAGRYLAGDVEAALAEGGGMNPDIEAITEFRAALFKHTSPDTFIAARAFRDDGTQAPPLLIRTTPTRDAVGVVLDMANEAAGSSFAVVVAPPIATFRTPAGAAESNLAEGVAISVDADTADPDAAREVLTKLLGEPTVVVASGGKWTDPETGEVRDRLHLHWRLAQPTHHLGEHRRLRLARELAAQLVGGDPSAVPVVHPFRWPGTLHMKRQPHRLASIVALNHAAEIDLEVALAALQGAVGQTDRAERSPGFGAFHKSQGGTASDLLARDVLDVVAALAAVPNSDAVEWVDWNKIGLAAYAASGGDVAGFAAWQAWSAKSPKHNAANCRARWQHYHRHKARNDNFSPEENRVGMGTLVHLARQAVPGWQLPRKIVRDARHAAPANGAECLLRAGQIKGVGPEHQPEEPLREIRTDGRTSSPLPLIYFDDAEPNLNVADFVEGLLSAGALSVVYGPSNCGKTFFATDLGLHVAAGMEWRGRAVDQGAVIYCALEGGSGISNRVAAWRREQGLDGEEIPFAIVPASINLLDPDADRQKLVSTIEIAASELKTPVVLIVIDTLSRAMAGGNENAPNDMGAVVNSADFIRQATKAHVMFIHHSGKDDSKGARGHSLLRAATDTEIEVSRSDSQAISFARVTKQREMEIEGEFGFKLRTVELGTNRRGKPVTSCVVEPVDGSAPKAGANRELTGNNKLALVALRQAIAARGIRRTGDPDTPSSVLSVTTEEWRQEFYARMPDHEQEAKRKAFSRATTELQNRKSAVVMNGIAWVLRLRVADVMLY